MDLDTALQQVQPWFAATATIENWAVGARALAMLRAALSSGVLDAARSMRTAGELAALTGIEATQMADMCAALHAHDVLDRVGEGYMLSSTFATLLAPDAYQSLSALIDIRMVEARTIASAGAPARAYTTLATEDLLAVAEGVTGQPTAQSFRNIFSAFIAGTMPEIHAILEAGGHWGEFGCGVGGGLLTILLLYPACTAVGLEINAQVVRETQKRIAALGIVQRAEVRHADVRDVTDEAVFDAGFWSQSFFPRASRAAALTAITRALKPGAYIYVPGFEGGEPPDGAEPRGPEQRSYALSRLVYDRWDIPTLTAPELRAELEAAGLEFVRYAPVLAWQYLLMRRPLA